MESNSDKMKGLRNAYKKTFESEEGKKVLADLEKVCLFKSSTFNKDPIVMAFQEGVRSVYLHILTITSIPLEQLEALAKQMEERNALQK